MQNTEFNYYDFSWGKGEIDLSLKSLQTLRMERSFEELANIQGNLLEIGCGEGRAIRTLKKYLNGVSAFGCDFSPHSIFQTKHYNDDTLYTQSDALNLPYKEKSFDAVVFFDLIEHVTDVEKVLHEIHRVLKNDGVLHCFVPCEIQFPTLYWALWKTRISPDPKKFVGHIQKFDEEIILAKLQESGFQPVKISYSYHYFGQLMDIALFTMIKYKSLFNLYYKLNESGQKEVSQKKSSVVANGFESFLVKIKNWIHRLAYYESKFLGNNKWAIGLHITNRKK